MTLMLMDDTAARVAAADPLALVGWPFLMMTTRQRESCSEWAAAG